MYGGKITVDHVTTLVGQLKAKFFDVDFFKVREDDHFILYKVKQLITKLGDHAFPDPLLQFMLDFGPFLK